MQLGSNGPRDLVALHARLLELERLTTAQEWWLYGAVLPNARRIAEIVSLLTAARADLVDVLYQLGMPQLDEVAPHNTRELRFAQSFAHDTHWARAHDEEATSILRLVVTSAPSLVALNERLLFSLPRSDASAASSAAGAAGFRAVLVRVGARLREIGALAGGA